MPRALPYAGDEPRLLGAQARGNVVRDRQTDDLLRADGWTVVRVWEHELAVEAATRIEDAVRALDRTR